jgi:predicted amidohydrolase
MQVAAVQLHADTDPVENRSRAGDAVAAAADRGVGLVVLPEATMCGYGPPDFDLASVAEPLDGRFVTDLVAAADRAGVTVVAGMFEALADEPRVYNTLVVVDGTGLVAHYRKLHLYDALGWKESVRVRPGDPEGDADGPGVVTVGVGGLELGLMTCYDLRFPEMARALVDAGATVLVLPAAWVAGEHKQDQWGTLIRARAIESTAYVVAAAQPGPEYSGYSMIVDPSGVVQAVLNGETEGSHALAVAEVLPARVDEERARMPVLAHRRFEVRPRP